MAVDCVAALEESSRLRSLRGRRRVAVDCCALRLRVRRSNLSVDGLILKGFRCLQEERGGLFCFVLWFWATGRTWTLGRGWPFLDFTLKAA